MMILTCEIRLIKDLLST